MNAENEHPLDELLAKSNLDLLTYLGEHQVRSEFDRLSSESAQSIPGFQRDYDTSAAAEEFREEGTGDILPQAEIGEPLPTNEIEVEINEAQQELEMKLRATRLARLGLTLLETNWTKIEGNLCEKWGACEKIRMKTYADEKQLAAAICDVLAATFSGLPVATLSVLVVRIGVRRFCKCE